MTGAAAGARSRPRPPALERLDRPVSEVAADGARTVNRVVVAGGGPSGMAAALCLARAGVPVDVLEKGPELATESRASTLHPATLELLDELGVVEPVLQRGLVAPRTQFRDRRSGPVATFDLGVLADETRFPYRVQLEQNKVAAIMAETLVAGAERGEWDARILMSHRAHGVRTTDADSVTVLIGTDEGFLDVTCPWLVAADGAHSAIRDSLGVTLDESVYPEKYLVVSVADDLSAMLDGLEHVNYVADPDQWLVLLRTPDHWRILFPLDANDPTPEGEPSAEVVARCLAGVVDAFGDSRPQWQVLAASVYTVRRAVVDTMRRGRVAIIGDAAHQNSPLGGMGMNSGLQDAVSLGRRLAKVWHGADESELDEFAARRRRVAVDYVQADSHANWLALREADPAKRRDLHADLRATAADPERHRDRARRTAMLGAVRASL